MLGGGLQSLIPDRGDNKPVDINNSPASSESRGVPPASSPSIPSSNIESAGNSGTVPFSPPSPPPVPILTPNLPLSPTPPDTDREVGSVIPSNLPSTPNPNTQQPPASSVLQSSLPPTIQPSSPSATQPPHDYVFQLEVDKIKPNPNQPRREFDETSLREMASSISEFGIIQPLVVTKHIFETPTGTGVDYELIAGERRLRAAKLAGLERVPAIIRNAPPKKEKLEMAIIENIQRENLNPIESARAFSQLQDEFNMTQREIAARIGKSRESIANTMRLLSLPTYVQEAVSVGRVSESQARLLLSISDFSAQQNLFEELIKNNLSVRELKNRIVSASARANAIRRFNETDPEIRHLEERLSELLGTKVKVEKSGDTGRITISFASPEELKGIIDRVLPPGEEI